MPRSLTIRNLTSIPLSLTLVQRFESGSNGDSSDKRGIDDKLKSLAGNFTKLMQDRIPGGSERKRLKAGTSGDAKPFKQDEVEVELEPFRTKKTQISAPLGQILRLTIEAEEKGEWHVDVPTPSGRSTPLIPASSEPGHEFTAIYNSKTAVLALFDSTYLRKWMNAFPDATPLSALSLPGTHNSPTCHQALPSVRCQAVSPLKQLENGVRFLDVRVQVNDADKGVNSDALELVHAAFPISLTASAKAKSLFDDVYGFLDRNPSETVIMSLKREGRGSGTDEIFSERLQKHYINANPQRWHTRTGIPRLGEVRGKIVLLRRFGLSEKLHREVHGKGGFGIYGSWADNTPNHLNGDIQIQDFYEVTDTENIDKKIQIVCEHFERAGAAVHPIGAPHTAAEGPKQPLFINFLSASNFWKPGCWPEKIAAKMNPAITQFLCEKHDIGDKGVDAPNQKAEGDGGLGVVVCDWVGDHDDWDLVRAIVGMNSRLLLRLQQQEDEEDEGDDSNNTRRGGRRGRGRGRGGRGRRGGRGARGGG
ncbi:uncharacterized protein LTR77_009636 [Saxophila tyrrhenica]|uniref:Phosphatidylinositol-specific phospholipase C X domain-containing protein n=1 Tax=Saxophila tyrrhenica TaxID=1690608 RepID=A0AAV9NYC3_9PEZI|nr:hypothetical protein LTR77_009636 [Saxophila tyrrhenica]